MDRNEFMYFMLGTVSMIIGMLAYPHVQRVRYGLKRMFTKKPKPASELSLLRAMVKEQQAQIDNIAKSVSSRKFNTRKVVREYLEELSKNK